MSYVKSFFPLPDISFKPYMIGSVIMVPSTTVLVPGFVSCNGAIISRVTYSLLFNMIGTKYGVGNGSTTFAIPDYRGLFLRGRDIGTGRDPDVWTRNLNPNALNSAVGSIQGQEIKTHSHLYRIDNNVWNAEGYADLNPPSPSEDWPSLYSGGNETRPKNYALVFIIKII